MAEHETPSQIPLLNLGYVNDRLSYPRHGAQQEYTPLSTAQGSTRPGSVSPPGTGVSKTGFLSHPHPVDGDNLESINSSRTNLKNYQPTSFISSIFPRIQVRRRTEIIVVAIFTVIVVIVIILASTLTTRAGSPSSTGATIPVSSGQYQGHDLPSGVTEFLGVRYGSMPQRFSAPAEPPQFSGVHIADTYGPECQGAGNLTKGNAEDCLFADIWAPTGATANSKFPVYVFTQGGGLTQATGRFNGTKLINAANNSIVFVSFSYRVGPFGFLASEEVQHGGNLNVGYLDQQQLLKFVQKDIAKFGGDPGHVTLGGQSAGAGSVVSQLLAYGGQDKGLFHSTLMQSSSMPAIRNVTDQQFQYDNIVMKAGCNTATDTLACLRGKTAQEILDATIPALPYPNNTGPPVFEWAPVIDGDFIRGLPMETFAKGEFIRVPTIFGDDTNEGTIFTPRSIATELSSRRFIQNNYPSILDTQLDEISRTYNFSTDGTTNGLPNTNQNSTYWQRAALAYGEIRYNCPGQHIANLMLTADPSMSTKIWHWRYNLMSPLQKRDGDLVSHGSELTAVFGPAPGSAPDLSVMLSSPQGQRVVQDVQGYWTSFVRDYDPNSRKNAGSPRWENWDGKSRVLFNLNATTMETVGADEAARCGYFAQITDSLLQ